MPSPVASAETLDDPSPPRAESSGPTADRRLVAALLGASAAFVVAFWTPLLGYGLMTDELLTAWVSSDGLLETIERAQRHQGNSPVYFALVWVWRNVAGSSEWILRLPSLVCTIAAAWHLFRLGAELDGERRLTGVVAAFVLVADTNVILRATTARPYGLLLLLSVLSARALARYLASGSWRSGFTWVLTAVASLAMTPFAAPALLAHLVALGDRGRGRHLTPLRSSGAIGHDPTQWRRRLPALFGLGLVVSLPMAPQVLALSRRSDELVFSSLPGVGDLIAALVPVSLFAAVAVGVAVGGWRGRLRIADPVLRFVGAWAVGPAVVLFTVSNITGNSLWVDRYRVIAVPAVALLVGLGVSRIGRGLGRAVAGTALVLVSLWSVTGFVGLQQQGWREAVEWARAETSGEPIVIALDSALVELGDLALLDDPEWVPYLSGPIVHYPLEGDVNLLPQGPGDDIVAHQQRVIGDLAETSRTIVLISRVTHRAPPDHLEAFRARLGAEGWTESSGPLVGPIQAFVFRR
ncbi:MAG: glycosyltransferase family 39 protein [Acidimicrobiales bacterium]